MVVLFFGKVQLKMLSITTTLNLHNGSTAQSRLKNLEAA